VKPVTIHTDGACEGNPGPGGWAAILSFGPHAHKLAGGEPATTNNRMELQAAIAALAALKEPCEATCFTDSEYLRQGVTEWLKLWKASRWRTVDRKPVKNDDLWRALDELVTRHRVTWHWLKGHAGHADNERCDQLARAEIAKIRGRFSSEQLTALRAEFLAARDPQRHQTRLF
jgi:ribonuclease HI